MHHLRRNAPFAPPPAQTQRPRILFVVGWAGMRGVVSLAAAAAIPLTDNHGAPLPDHWETDVRADYAFAKGTWAEGFVATFRYSWLHQDGSPQIQTDLRAILNYNVRF